MCQYTVLSDLRLDTLRDPRNDFIDLAKVLENAFNGLFKGIDGQVSKSTVILGDEACLKLRYMSKIDFDRQQKAHQLQKVIVQSSILKSQVLHKLFHLFYGCLV